MAEIVSHGTALHGTGISTLTIEQLVEGHPFGQPFGVIRTGAQPEWFSTEQEAWDFRDQCLDLGFPNVQVIGAPAHLACVVPNGWDTIGGVEIID